MDSKNSPHLFGLRKSYNCNAYDFILQQAMHIVYNQPWLLTDTCIYIPSYHFKQKIKDEGVYNNYAVPT